MTGRYVFRGSAYVSDNAAEAERLTKAWKSEIPRFVPDVTIIYVGRPLKISDYPYGSQLIIWSDGVASVSLLYPKREPTSYDLSVDAEWIIRQAIRKPQWEHGKWQRFKAVSTVVKTKLASDNDSRVTLNSSSSWEADIYELCVTYTSGGQETLYWGYLSAGSLGEDGDAWSDHTLVETKTEVDDWLKEQRQIYS